ncbi:MAG: hypothetical protein ABIR55_10610 [Burkholderiaceae bacterium]
MSAILLGSSMVASAASPGVRDSQYNRELQACQDGRSGQDKDTCMTEARRALAARKKGALQTDTSATAANARKRCEVMTGDDKAACLARMDARGSTSGSVAGGGILREVVTPVAPSASASAAATPSTMGPSVQAPTKP